MKENDGVDECACAYRDSALVWGGVGIFRLQLCAWLFGGGHGCCKAGSYTTFVGLAGYGPLSLLLRSWERILRARKITFLGIPRTGGGILLLMTDFAHTLNHFSNFPL